MDNEVHFDLKENQKCHIKVNFVILYKCAEKNLQFYSHRFETMTKIGSWLNLWTGSCV